MWIADEKATQLIRYHASVSTRGQVVVIGGGPVGLLAALERAKTHNDKVLVIEKREIATRSQVVALREEMSSFLLDLVETAKPNLTEDAYTEINALYVKHVRYEPRGGRVITFQLSVLESLLRKLAIAYDIKFELGTVLAVTQDKDVIYVKQETKEASNAPYKLAIDASGGYIQNYTATYENINLHPLHATFEFSPPPPSDDNDIWKELANGSPTTLEVSYELLDPKYSEVWPLERAPLTRVFPFRDAEGNHKVYIGSEIPYLSDGVEFIKWLLQQRFPTNPKINKLRIQQTSTFVINGLKYNKNAFDDTTATLKIGDAFFQPHYLTASGINNAYGELTDLQLVHATRLNHNLNRRRVTYYEKLTEVLMHPDRAGTLFFQACTQAIS